MHLISLNLVHPVDSGVDKSECQLLGFYKAKTHKVIQEHKSVLRNCHLPCHRLLMGKQGGCTQKGQGRGGVWRWGAPPILWSPRGSCVQPACPSGSKERRQWPEDVGERDRLKTQSWRGPLRAASAESGPQNRKPSIRRAGLTPRKALSLLHVSEAHTRGKELMVLSFHLQMRK